MFAWLQGAERCLLDRPLPPEYCVEGARLQVGDEDPYCSFTKYDYEVESVDRDSRRVYVRRPANAEHHPELRQQPDAWWEVVCAGCGDTGTERDRQSSAAANLRGPYPTELLATSARLRHLQALAERRHREAGPG